MSQLLFYMFGNGCSVYCPLANLLSLMTIFWVSLVSQFLLGVFFTCSRREPLGVRGRVFLWAGYPPYHQINSAEALMKHKHWPQPLPGVILSSYTIRLLKEDVLLHLRRLSESDSSRLSESDSSTLVQRRTNWILWWPQNCGLSSPFLGDRL